MLASDASLCYETETMRVTYALVVLCVAVVGCKGDKDKPAKTAEAPPAEPSEPTLQVDQGELAVDGPVPPQTNMVFYVVDGALLPLGCYDKAKGAIAAGKTCLNMIESGAEVRISASDSAFNKTVGEKAVPQCLTGTTEKVAWSVAGISEGAAFKFAAWPPSALKVVQPVEADTTAPRNTQLDEDETQALLSAMKAKGARIRGDLSAHQIAEIDLDGRAPKEKFYSVYVPHPTEPEQYLWTGAFVAQGGDLTQLTLLESSKNSADAFEVRGTLDLDGDGVRELWMRLVFDGGAGDRLLLFKQGIPSPLGPWSCEAV